MSGDFPSPKDWFASLNKNLQELLSKEEINALYKNAKQQHNANQAQAALHTTKLLAPINPDAVRNITALNEIIPLLLEGQVGGPETEARRTIQSTERQRGRDIPKTVGRVFPDQCRGGAASPPACDWPIMESSGESSDCLLHSFLTATCPNFRRLKRDQKNQFAHSFRVDLLPKYPEILAHFEASTPDDDDRTAEDRFFGDSFFLGDEDLQAICRVFEVNVVVVQGKRRRDPAMMISFIEYDDDRVFFIYNNGTNHFESIRPNPDYYLTQAEAQVTTAPFVAQTGQETKPQCDYSVGDEVEYRGKKYRVTGRVYGNSNAKGVIRCRAVTLEPVEGGAEITVPVTDLAKNTAHVRASGEVMAAGPGVENAAQVDKKILQDSIGLTEQRAADYLKLYGGTAIKVLQHAKVRGIVKSHITKHYIKPDYLNNSTKSQVVEIYFDDNITRIKEGRSVKKLAEFIADIKDLGFTPKQAGGTRRARRGRARRTLRISRV